MVNDARLIKPDQQNRLFRRSPDLAPGRLHRRHRVEPDGPGHRQKFDHVETPLEAFYLGDVRLRLAEQIGHRLLGQAGLRPCINKASDQFPIGLVLDCLGQWGALRLEQKREHS